MDVHYLFPINCLHPDEVSEDCSICCEEITDKAYVKDCFHHFCYPCILQWIQIRAVCPLCIQPINSIINNIRSRDEYDIQLVEPPQNNILSDIDNDLEWWAIRDEINSETSEINEPAAEFLDLEDNSNFYNDGLPLDFSDDGSEQWYEDVATASSNDDSRSIFTDDDENKSYHSSTSDMELEDNRSIYTDDDENKSYHSSTSDMELEDGYVHADNLNLDCDASDEDGYVHTDNLNLDCDASDTENDEYENHSARSYFSNESDPYNNFFDQLSSEDNSNYSPIDVLYDEGSPSPIGEDHWICAEYNNSDDDSCSSY